MNDLRDPVRNINAEFLQCLSLAEAKVYPLPGGVFPRGSDPDLRLSKLTSWKHSDLITYYEHVATVKDTKTGTYYVAFRETMDALLAQQKDPNKFPEWLMKHPVKRTECKIYVYVAYRHPKSVPGGVQVFTDWLQHIEQDWIQDTLFYFLLKKNVISQDMYGST